MDFFCAADCRSQTLKKRQVLQFLRKIKHCSRSSARNCIIRCFTYFEHSNNCRLSFWNLRLCIFYRLLCFFARLRNCKSQQIFYSVCVHCSNSRRFVCLSLFRTKLRRTSSRKQSGCNCFYVVFMPCNLRRCKTLFEQNKLAVPFYENAQFCALHFSLSSAVSRSIFVK